MWVGLALVIQNIQKYSRCALHVNEHEHVVNGLGSELSVDTQSHAVFDTTETTRKLLRAARWAKQN